MTFDKDLPDLPDFLAPLGLLSASSFSNDLADFVLPLLESFSVLEVVGLGVVGLIVVGPYNKMWTHNASFGIMIFEFEQEI